MANQDSNDEYYSYSKLEKFRRCERHFRSVQAVLLLFMVVCFVVSIECEKKKFFFVFLKFDFQFLFVFFPKIHP